MDESVSAWFSLSSIALFFGYLFFCYKRSFSHFCLSFFPFYVFFSLLVSSIVIGFGVPMIEINAVGSANGSVWAVLFFLFLFIEASYISYDRLRQYKFESLSCKFPLNVERFISFVFVAIILAWGVAVFSLFSSPVFVGVDRISFYENYVPGAWSLLPTIANQFSFFLVFYLLSGTKGVTRFSIILCILYFLMTVFVLGEKFTSFIVYLTFGLFAFSALSKNKCFGKQFIFYFLIFLFFLVIVVVWTYERVGYGWQFILMRVALQSQLLWAVLEQPADTLFFGENFSCYWGCGRFNSGRDFISAQFLPEDLYLRYKEGGSKLSGFMPALNIYTMGFFGSVFFLFLSGSLVGAFEAVVFRFIQAKNLFASFLLAKALIGILFLFFSAMSTALNGVIFSILLLIAWSIIVKASRSKSQKLYSS